MYNNHGTFIGRSNYIVLPVAFYDPYVEGPANRQERTGSCCSILPQDIQGAICLSQGCLMLSSCQPHKKKLISPVIAAIVSAILRSAYLVPFTTIQPAYDFGYVFSQSAL